MSNTSLNQCPNCGAGLDPVNSDVIKCPYCGSAFNNPNKQTRQTETGDMNTGAGTQRKTVNQQKRSGMLDPDLNPKPTPPLKWRKGTRTAYIFLFFALSFFISVIVLTADKHDDNDHLPITDTLKTDTSSRFTIGKNSIYDSVNNSSRTAILKQLSPIKTDSITFRKLYAEARKKNNQPSNNIFIYDRSSPKAIKDNGIYTYIDKTDKGSSLRYCIQYNAGDWLFINK